jgi:hypothetical protein bacD2_24110
MSAKGKVVDGEWVSGIPVEISVSGRYDPVSDGRIVLKRNSAGDEAQVHGYFYTKMQPPAGSKFLRLKVASKDIDVPVICWEPYQSHSIINV